MNEFKNHVEGQSNDLISFDDHKKRRELIFNSVQKAVEQRFPIENDRYILSVANVGYGTVKEKNYGLSAQKDAILSGKSMTKALKARFILTDKATGQVIEKSPLKTVANVPYLTRRNTFIRNGSESLLINQMRMVPGAYSKKTNDNKYETLVNVKQGTGNVFKLQLDPKTAVFSFKAGGRKIPAYPVFKAMGLDDDTLKAQWGEEIWKKNYTENDSRALHSAYEAFIPNYKKESTIEEK